jgi:small redox-active disulfide protein 1
MILIKLFTSSTCPACPKAKEVVERIVKEDKDVIVMEFQVNTDEGMKEALKYNVRAVPTLVLNDRYMIVGVPSYERLREIIERLKEET